MICALGCLAFSAQMQAATDTPDPGSVGPTNTADGDSALPGATGFYNSAFGFLSLFSNGAASFNTGVGAGSLFSNVDAIENTAVGSGALFSSNGASNTAVGAFALFSNTTGMNNVAVGLNTLLTNTIGAQNTAIGNNALINNTEGNINTALGGQTLVMNTTGSQNTAVGKATLINNTTGSSNTALGFNSGNNVVTASNVICIGNPGDEVSSTTWVGNVFGVTTVSGTTAPVIVSDTGQLGTVASSERFKKDISTMDRASEVILALRPVTFHYKSDVKDTPQFGLIAEEVAKVNPSLVLPDKEGKPYTVRYDAVNAMLLNEFLKEHRTVQEQQKEIDALKAELKEHASQIQKVSAQLQLSKPEPQTVQNNR